MTRIIKINGKRYRWNIKTALKNAAFGTLGAAMFGFYMWAFLVFFTGGAL